MHHKLNVVRLRALGYRFNGFYVNFSLDHILFDIVESKISQEKGPILLHHPSVDLDDDAGEDNFLTARGVELGNDFWVVSTALEILEFWFLGFHDMVLIIN